MEFLTKNKKLVQLAVVFFGFFVLVLMTGQYSEIIDVRDGFTNAVEDGKIVAVTGFSESISMIMSGQLPPQLVRIPQLNFLNPVVSNSGIYLFVSLMIILGLVFRNYYSVSQSKIINPAGWLKENWTKLFSYSIVSFFAGLFIIPTLVTWIFGNPGSSSFWNLPTIVTDFANFLMYDWFPVQVYDPDIEEFEDKALIFQINL